MEFKQFREKMQEHVSALLKQHSTLFITNVDKDELWNLYLDSFPSGTNEIFRERREHDCSCCKNFIRSFGNVVVIEDDNKITSIWDFKTNDTTYQPVVDALAEFVKSASIKDVFVTKEKAFGVDHNFEKFEDTKVRTWHHFRIDLPQQFVTRSSKSEASLMGEFRDVKSVFQRSLEEISRDAIETTLDLISQNSLYKGEEWKGALEKFGILHGEYHKSKNTASQRDCYCWRKSKEVGGAIGKIKNHSIGVFLVDITNGMDLNDALKKYENIVAPTNYKRPKAIFTKRMIEQAQTTLSELGLLDSLGRRFATIEDITVNNILFANKDTLNQMKGDIFAELRKEVAGNPKQFDKVEEIPIEQFIKDILPRTTNIEIFLENRHTGNLVSVIAPQNKDSKTLFKWDNGFSWAYNGNITDSMKERVKAAGGNVEGVLRFSLQWNENHDNENDFDAHCVEPNGNHIYYSNKGKHITSGMLDVDILHPKRDQVAVENITWTSLDRMKEGVYEFYIQNFTHRGGRSGFSAEIEYDGQIYSYEYNKELRHKENVLVAVIEFNKKEGIKFLKSLPSSTSSKKIWGLDTNQFHPVSICMFSPNYWDLQTGIGHRHYLFIVNGCINDTSPNGFFNEFLREDLMVHKRVFEALGNKMKVEFSPNQLSGLGFSTTKRASLVCKLEGHMTRTVKLVF